MSKLMIALFVAAGLSFAASVSAQGNMSTSTSMSTPMSRDLYTAAKKDADARYKVDKAACSSLSGNAKDICVAEAVADKRDANYKVAIEKCDALAGPAKDACVSSAKAQFGKS